MTYEIAEKAELAPAELADAKADARRAGLEFIKKIILTDAFHEVASSFAEPHKPNEFCNDNAALAPRLEFMAKFAAQHLDFRQGKSRADMPKPNLTDRQENALALLGEEAGMVGAQNAFGVDADIYAVHGTYGPAIYSRLVRAKDHLDTQQLLFPTSQPIIIGLASDRPLAPRDSLRPKTMAPYAQNEWGIMSGGFNYVLGGRWQLPKTDDPNVNWYELPGGSTGLALRARKREGERGLANTADTQIYAAEVLGAEALAGAEVVGVTTQVYSLFQEADLRRKWGLEYGSRIHMAGFYDPEMTQPHHIGAEFKAAIDHAGKLYEALEEIRRKELEGWNE